MSAFFLSSFFFFLTFHFGEVGLLVWSMKYNTKRFGQRNFLSLLAVCIFLGNTLLIGKEVLVAQLCLTLCDSMDCSPPCSSVHGDSPGRNTGVGCHALFQGIFQT